MVDDASVENMSSDLRYLYALKCFVESQQPILEKELVKKYAAVLEKYIEEHENDIGGRFYSIKKKLSGHIKSLEPTFKIYLNKSDFSDYWDGLFNGTLEEMMPEWIDLFGDNINAVYNSLKEVGDINSQFLEEFDNINIVAETDIPEKLKIIRNYKVEEKVYSKYREDMSFALNKYNKDIQALVDYMDDVGSSSENTVDAGDNVKDFIDKSNETFKVINDTENRETVLQGAFLLKNDLSEIQKLINLCLTDSDENCEFDGSSLRNLDNRSFMGMLYKLENIEKNGQEFKERALKSLGYEIENKTGFEFFKSDPRSGEGKIVSREFYRIAVRKKD